MWVLMYVWKHMHAHVKWLQVISRWLSQLQLGIKIHTYNLGTCELEAGVLLQVEDTLDYTVRPWRKEGDSEVVDTLEGMGIGWTSFKYMIYLKGSIFKKPKIIFNKQMSINKKSCSYSCLITEKMANYHITVTTCILGLCNHGIFHLKEMYLYQCFTCMCVCVPCPCRAGGGQKRGENPWN